MMVQKTGRVWHSPVRAVLPNPWTPGERAGREISTTPARSCACAAREACQPS